jgi:hypothetical protein
MVSFLWGDNVVTALVGVECPICHNEAFQLLEREAQLALGITVRVKVCARCARTVDAANEEEDLKEQLASLDKAERRREWQEKSFAWADALHGRRVTLYFQGNIHPVYWTTECQRQVQGVAWRISNASGGWGQVKVVIDPSEHHRIYYGCANAMECPVTGQDMSWSFRTPCDVVDCEDRRPIMDKPQGMWLLEQDGSYYKEITWAARKCLVLNE